MALVEVCFAVEGLELEGSFELLVGGSVTEDEMAAAGGCLARCPLVFMAQHKKTTQGTKQEVAVASKPQQAITQYQILNEAKQGIGTEPKYS